MKLIVDSLNSINIYLHLHFFEQALLNLIKKSEHYTYTLAYGLTHTCLYWPGSKRKNKQQQILSISHAQC